MNNDRKETPSEDECVIHDHPVPGAELFRYSIERDVHSERDIANYVEGQATDEAIHHVELIKREVVVGQVYEIWDVTTDKDRWWVISNITNLYSQKYFPSLDYTLSFHIGLMMRLKSRSGRVDADDPRPFDEVLRRMDQAQNKHDGAVEAEEYQSVGMLLRESLISLIAALRRRTEIPTDVERPQDANFIAWTEALMNQLCGGSSNKELRQHLKNTAKECWQFWSIGLLIRELQAKQPHRLPSILAKQPSDTSSKFWREVGQTQRNNARSANREMSERILISPSRRTASTTRVAEYAIGQTTQKKQHDEHHNASLRA